MTTTKNRCKHVAGSLLGFTLSDSLQRKLQQTINKF